MYTKYISTYRVWLMAISLLLSITLIIPLTAQFDDVPNWSFVFRTPFSISVADRDLQNIREVIEFRPDIVYLSLSPNSQYVTYLIPPRLPGADDYAGPTPQNIYVLNLETGVPTIIAGTPEGATQFGQGIVRNIPVWSPDGNSFAWTEGFEEGRLFVADVTTLEVREIRNDVPPQTLVPLPARIHAWTPELGIVIERVQWDENFSNPQTVGWNLYTPEGALTSVDNTLTKPIMNYRVVFDGVREFLAVQTADDWYRLAVTPDTAPELLRNGIFVLQNSSALTSLMVAPAEIQTDGTATYDIYNGGGMQIATLNGQNDNATILRPTLVDDGNIVYLRDATNNHNFLFYEREDDADLEGGFFTLDLPDDYQVLVPSGNRTNILPDSRFFTSSYCVDTSLSTRLFVDAIGYVIPGQGANNLRTSPSTAGDLITAIPENDWFTVIDNPVCADGFAWWQVDYQGTVGWTAEAGTDSYWIAPGCPREDGQCVVGQG